jgi:predicted DCC family thiol-disulfide oxidoreductase YuxK
MVAIVFFDGDCAFCHASVRWIIAWDPHRVFRFAPLQSRWASHFLTPVDAYIALDSLVLWQAGTTYTHSDAVLRIAKSLDGVVRWAYGLHVVPRVLRDPVYRFIARRRKRWLRDSACAMPTDAMRQRIWTDAYFEAEIGAVMAMVAQENKDRP